MLPSLSPAYPSAWRGTKLRPRSGIPAPTSRLPDTGVERCWLFGVASFGGADQYLSVLVLSLVHPPVGQALLPAAASACWGVGSRPRAAAPEMAAAAHGIPSCHRRWPVEGRAHHKDGCGGPDSVVTIPRSRVVPGTRGITASQGSRRGLRERPRHPLRTPARSSRRGGPC